MKVAMFPLNGPSAASMVPPEFLELAEKAFGADDSSINNDGGGGDSNSGVSEQKMQKGDLMCLLLHYYCLHKLRPVVPNCIVWSTCFIH